MKVRHIDQAALDVEDSSPPLNQPETVQASLWERLAPRPSIWQPQPPQRIVKVAYHCSGEVTELLPTLFNAPEFSSSDEGGGGGSDNSDEDSDGGWQTASSTSSSSTARGGKPMPAHPRESSMRSRFTLVERLDADLVSLQLSDWPSEQELITAIQQYGAASVGSIQHLSLLRPMFCSRRADNFSVATSRAIAEACPGVRWLHLQDENDDEDGSDEMHLKEAAFQPLHGLNLQKLSSLSYCRFSSSAMASLGGLTTLRCLNICLANTPRAATLQPLTSLRNLVTCQIQMPQSATHPTIVDVAPLFTLTRLVELHLRISHDSARRTPLDGTAAATAQLRRMANLETLVFGSGFVVDDAVFAALRCLRKLNRLDVSPCQQAVLVSAAQVPVLQHRCPEGGCSGYRRPVGPLTLLPLLVPRAVSQQQIGRMDSPRGPAI